MKERPSSISGYYPLIFWNYSWKWGHPCPMDTFIILILIEQQHYNNCKILYYFDGWQFYLTVCEKVRENEAVKMIRLKEGLIKMSEAYMMMGKKCSVLFEAQRVSTLIRVGKKAGNTHISQDGGKYWYLPGNTGI